MLRPGGTLRTSVPDFAAIGEVYRRTGDLDLVMGPLFGRQDYLYNIHHNVFDLRTLTRALEQTGFGGVDRYDWRETEHAHIDDYSQAYVLHKDKEHGVPISLNVRARKPRPA